MVLIFPPVAKPCEPPAGVALLAGALKQSGRQCTVVDANLEGILWLLNRDRLNSGPGLTPSDATDVWSRRALSHLERNLSDLRSPGLYRNNDRYRQRVMDVNRALQIQGGGRFRISLSDFTDQQRTPLKSADLLAAARHCHDNPFYPFFEQRLPGLIDEDRSGFVGISLCYLSQALTAFALAGWIRLRFPEKNIIMGGGLITSWMSAPGWCSPFQGLVHTLVRGRGECRIVTLLEPERHKNRDRDPGLPVTPDFDFCRWNDYLAPGPVLPYRTAAGCYWRKCRFCPERAEGHGYHPMKPGQIQRDLTRLVRRHAVLCIHFLDDALSPAVLKHLAGVRLPAIWYGFARLTKELADPEFCRALYRSGCRMLKLGLESGDQAVLDRMNKGTCLDLSGRILRTLHDAGIATYVYLLFGTRFEDEAAAHKTLAFTAAHSHCIDFLNLAIFNLPRFSDDARLLATDAFYDGDLSLYAGFQHPLGWDRKKVRYFLDRRFKKHPAIAPILRRDPPFFTSNHAAFMPPVR